MRGLLFLIVLIVVYYTVRTIVRSALNSQGHERSRKRIKGEEMVLCPDCNTYVVKDRTVVRRIGGSSHSFCSEACAGRYEQKHRD